MNSMPHTVDVGAFEIDRYKVSNGDYLKFINAGGYGDKSLWTEDGWQWKSDHGITKPVFWTSEHVYRTMFEEISMPLDWPVYVSPFRSQRLCPVGGKRFADRS